MIALREEDGTWRGGIQRITRPVPCIPEQLLERISGDETSAQSELPEIQKALQEMTPWWVLVLSSVAAAVARQKVVGVIFIFRDT